MNRLKRFLTPPLIVIASLLMWIEESLWHWLKRVTRWIAVIPLVHRFEAWLVRLSPYPTVVVFLVPMTTLFPLKVLAVYWVTRGYWLPSLMLIAFAKVLGTAIVARMYVVCQPKLMTIAWFRQLHAGLYLLRNHLYAALQALPFYRAIRARLASIKLVAKSILARLRTRNRIWWRWLAIRRWRRQKSKT